MNRLFTLTISLVVALCAYVTHAAELSKRQQCSETLDNAGMIAQELQSKFWNESTGSYKDGELWTDANTLEDLHNFMLAAESNTFGSVADSSYIGRAALNPKTNWTAFLGGSYDDAQWIILALWKISDYKASRGQNYGAYMSSSLAIYDIVAAQWDDICGGGVWWSSAHTYKNAITNELFLLTSAEAYLRTGNRTYLDNAIMESEWISASGMQNSDGLFNDGLDTDTCQNNGQTTWTYNQAVIASGLAALSTALPWPTDLIQRAQVSLDATIRSSLTYNDILKESCDDAEAGGSLCDHDQQLFKGLWTKHVQYFLDSANNASITAKYSPFLWSQYSAVYHYGMNASHDVGSVWYAPDQGGSEWGPQPSASGLEAVVSAAKYAPCQAV